MPVLNLSYGCHLEVIPKKQFKKLDKRRIALKMSKTILSKRSSVPFRKLNRILQGKQEIVKKSYLDRILFELKMGYSWRNPVQIVAEKTVKEVLQDRAITLARRLVSLVNGSMNLEGSALSKEAKEKLIKDSAQRLLKTPRKLW